MVVVGHAGQESAGSEQVSLKRVESIGSRQSQLLVKLVVGRDSW